MASRFNKEEQALHRFAQRMQSEGSVPGTEDTSRCLARSILGKLILFFRDQPDEYMTYSDMVIKYLEGKAEDSTLLGNLQRGLSRGALSAKIVDGELRIYGGPNLEKINVPKSKRNLLGGSRIRRTTVMYDVLTRLKENPELELETGTLDLPERRFRRAFRFAIDNKLVSVYIRKDGVRMVKAGPKLMSATYMRSGKDTILQIIAAMDSHSAASISKGVKLELSPTEFDVLRSFLGDNLSVPNVDSNVESKVDSNVESNLIS